MPTLVMSAIAPATPPVVATAPDPPKDAVVPPKTEDKGPSWWDKLTVGLSLSAFGLLLIIPIVFAILFHFGAAYLSYQKYGSVLWSILDFFFAVFYYPFYAFFLAKDPGPSMGMMGGRRRRA